MDSQPSDLTFCRAIIVNHFIRFNTRRVGINVSFYYWKNIDLIEHHEKDDVIFKLSKGGVFSQLIYLTFTTQT